jgi:hypothetical protein
MARPVEINETKCRRICLRYMKVMDENQLTGSTVNGGKWNEGSFLQGHS